ISYSGTNSVSDNLTATNRTFTGTANADIIHLSNSGGNDGRMTVTSSSIALPNPTVNFVNPTGALTINAGDGPDQIYLEGLDAAFGASLKVDGGGDSDDVNIQGDLTLAGNKNLDLNLQDDAGTAGRDNIFIAAGADISLSGTGTATLKASRAIFFDNG